jgi:hypothetical protein
MCQFLAPNTSYKKFLKAFKVEEAKGFFPYEWFDSPDKLECTSLPGADDFYSELKGCNVLEEDLLAWCEGDRKGPMPKCLDENYMDIQEIWRENKMSTFRDYLVYYNNADVGPFVKCIERYQSIFKDQNLDVFKIAISIPGIARKMLFQEAERQQVNFSLFGKDHEDLYRTVKQNIVGGPSIIFSRHHKVGKSCIRCKGGKKCVSV